MLKLQHLSAHYGSSQALFDVNLELGEGQMVTLLGRNGMGKTSTVHAIMGLLPPSGGQITFCGTALRGLPSFRIAKLGLGLVPEGRQVFPNLSVRENLIATASNLLIHKQPWTLQRVLTLFPELAQRLGSMGNLLSGGEQQMLAIGRALMTNPRLLILDEATEGLAPLVRKRIWQALAAIRDTGMSILIVDKNLHDLIKLADHHVIIQRGRSVWSGSAQALMADVDLRSATLGL